LWHATFNELAARGQASAGKKHKSRQIFHGGHAKLTDRRRPGVSLQVRTIGMELAAR
jgi:hypothetical protein